MDGAQGEEEAKSEAPSHLPQGISLPFPRPFSLSLPPHLFGARPLLRTRIPAWLPAHPPRRALLSGAGSGKAPLDSAAPRAPCAHPLHFTWTRPRRSSGAEWAKDFSPGGTRGFALRNSRLREESFPPRCPAPGPHHTGACVGGSRAEALRPAPPARPRPSSRARSAPFRVGCSVFPELRGPGGSRSGANEAVTAVLAGGTAPPSGGEAACGPKRSNLSPQLGGGREWGVEFWDPAPGGC